MSGKTLSIKTLPTKTLSTKTLSTLAALRQADLIPAESQALAAVAARYAIAVSPAMASLAGDTAISRQFIPDIRELDGHPDERPDPIGDHAHSPVKGVVHRYPDRALLKIVHVCPVYCRFCFRREMVGPDGDGGLTPGDLDAAFAYLGNQPGIRELILTGGDPLMLSGRRITEVMKRLEAIAHIRLVRWHSRVPVVAPERMTSALIKALKQGGKTVYLSIHANHTTEFTHAAREAITRLADAGIVLLGQSVLLRGVNDETGTLRALFETMSELRIRPAYLHHPDLAPGTAHFRLSIPEGQAIYSALRGTLSGHAIPIYVLDLPGGFGKVPIAQAAFRETSTGLEIRDPHGNWHCYPPVSAA